MKHNIIHILKIMLFPIALFFRGEYFLMRMEYEVAEDTSSTK